MAGEKSGNLEEVLTRFISFQRITLTFRKKLIASLVYPTLLIVMVTVMFTFLISFVVPRFGELYSQLGSTLPAITVFMLALGNNSQKYLPILFITFIVIVILFLRWKRSETGQRQFDKMRLATPMLGEIWLKYQVALFCRTLSTLLIGGLPLVPALETAGSSINSASVATKVKDAIQVVREGKPLSNAMEGGVFPDMAIEMIEVGEATGALPAMLNSVADFFEEDVQTALSSALSLIEPAILIVMGVVVATVLFSLYLPIFSLGAGIQ
jgi:type IV pilus assembly protein PilC